MYNWSVLLLISYLRAYFFPKQKCPGYDIFKWRILNNLSIYDTDLGREKKELYLPDPNFVKKIQPKGKDIKSFSSEDLTRSSADGQE